MHLTASYCAELPHDSLRIHRVKTVSYRDGLATPRSFERELWPGIERAVLKTVLLAWPLLAGYDKMLQSGGAEYRRFAFLSFDVLLSHSGHSYVEEVNTNGFLMGTRIPQGWRYTLDAMRLLGIGGYPDRPRYQAQLEAQLEGLCAVEGCDISEVEALLPVIDESEHAGQFARLFPAASAGDVQSYRRLTAQTAGRLDDLSHKLAARFYAESEARRKHEQLAPEPDGDEDGRRWDWFGSEGNWRQEKAAVRQENRELMQTIRSARHYQVPTPQHGGGSAVHDRERHSDS